MGVPEGKVNGDVTVFIQKLLTSVPGWDETMQPPETDQAHRAPIPRPNPGERLNDPGLLSAHFTHRME